MTKASDSMHPVRTAVRTLLAVAVGAGLLLSLPGLVGPGQAGAAGAKSVAGSVTYSATLNIPAPPPSNFAGSAGGDGWGLAMTPTAVYNVFHHSAALTVACHLQSDASACWPNPKTIVDGSSNNFATSGQPGLWLDQTNGHLFVFATRTSDSTAGVVCIDTTLPAADTGAQIFCGFTALSAVGEAPLLNGISGTSDPVIVGSNWYSFNAVAATPTGTRDELMCFSLVTLSGCASQPYAVTLGAGAVSDIGFPSPSIAAFSNQIAIPVQLNGSKDELACFDANTTSNCSGSWPAITTSISYPPNANTDNGGGAPFPLLNSGGATTGLCLPIVNTPCFDLAGGSVAPPAGLSAAVTPNPSWDGTSIVIGARVYVPVGRFSGGDEVNCYDYSAGAGCANFPKTFANLSLLYSVNPDPQRPTCIWVNSDGGADQIQNFDAYSGGACGTGPTRVLAASLVAPYNVCIPSNYTSLQVLVPARNAYASGSVQFLDFDGNAIPGLPAQPLDATGSVNLTPFNLATISALPQFLITLVGAGNPPQVDVKLTWVGNYSPNCTSGGQTVSGLQTGQGYRLGAFDGGVFSFGTAAFKGSMAGQPLNAPEVGIASTPDGGGYWLAAADGGVFAFGDAGFFGSLGNNMNLNAPILGIAATPDGMGYWLIAADGGVFCFGDARYHGSLGGQVLAAPIVGIAATPDGKGYWLVGSNGGVYNFGTAVPYGSKAGQFLNGPIVGIASSNDGKGYWFAGADGGVFAFGDARFEGSMYGAQLSGPIVGMLPTPDGNGYWLAGADGGVFALGDAQFLGSMALSPLNAPIDGITS